MGALLKKGIGIGAGGDIGFGGGPSSARSAVTFGSFSSGGGFNPFASATPLGHGHVVWWLVGGIIVVIAGAGYIVTRK